METKEEIIEILDVSSFKILSLKSKLLDDDEKSWLNKTFVSISSNSNLLCFSKYENLFIVKIPTGKQ
jgi:hypothetical protein